VIVMMNDRFVSARLRRDTIIGESTRNTVTRFLRHIGVKKAPSPEVAGLTPSFGGLAALR
jgi:hypothetical protein